ncbi:hypothetical protein PVAP13_1NG020780 [Panicum virgatum]|uniref:Uncharacterized protein n=1 Tax=Panicum virgatum TaxID=38727 RepID=A0A8T0WS50_PANVG|nr:hypothetical protein PVAP13_1NG020780 [Panicum virgatum]
MAITRPSEEAGEGRAAHGRREEEACVGPLLYLGGAPLPWSQYPVRRSRDPASCRARALPYAASRGGGWESQRQLGTRDFELQKTGGLRDLYGQCKGSSQI